MNRVPSLLSIIGNSRVKISLLSDGTLVSDRNDPLASTNEGVDLHGAKFQYFFPDEKYFVYRPHNVVDSFVRSGLLCHDC